MSATPQMSAYAEQLIRGRRATRAFLPDPVPEQTLHDIFSLAGAAPSSSNTQPWLVEVVSGGTRDRLSKSLLTAKEENKFTFDFPYSDEMYSGNSDRWRRDMGARMYGAMGIARDDHEGRHVILRDNLRFFGAPHVALMFMPPNAEERMANDTGIYAQTLMLAMAAHGVASCPQASLGFFCDTIRETLGISDNKLIFGISFGYADESSPRNEVRMPRAELSETTRFHS
ncbi:nitroreductase [Streptomyces sp. NEAU-Y11]|uniref:nitroreductase n=1 Tax=Streptomyces cucumeris TaxID=2962890 RepID=UPI0020C87B54|nr:nitroreductase [Streptomyces sp. NEAU-Y11]MCP9211795.1 nitroreductase [Streptomyces sp. NEAU-Y11]